MREEIDLETFGLCATYFLCTGFGYRAQIKCDLFERAEDKKTSTCKYCVKMIDFQECSNPKAIALSFNHKDPEHHEANMEKTFLVRSEKYQKEIASLRKEIKKFEEELNAHR